MNTNGHERITNEEVDQIIDKWSDIVASTKEELHGPLLKDSSSFQERELEVITSVIIPAAFAFGSGSAPNDLEDDPTSGMMWDYPRFARMIAMGASEERTTTEIFIKRSLAPLINHEEKPRLAVLENLFGKDGMPRLHEKLIKVGLISSDPSKNEDIGTIRKSKKPLKADSSDDPEELKSIPQFITAHSG